MPTYTRGKISRKRSPYSTVLADAVSVTLTTEAADARTATIQLKNGGANLAEVAVIKAYLSDVSTGIGICATAPTGNVVIGASGVILTTEVTDKVWSLITNATGAVALTITESGAKTFYLCVVLSDGSISKTVVAFA